MQKKTRKLFSYLVVFSAFLISGCTMQYPPPDFTLIDQGSEYSLDKKLDLTVNLCLSDELRSSKWERSSMGDTFIVEFGNQLAKNSKEVSELLFNKVIVTNEPMSGENGKVDAILTPKFLATDRTFGSWVWEESIFSIVMEWKMESVENNIVWIDSIRGEGREESGSAYNHRIMMKQQLEKLFKDLFSKSFYAIKESPEIKKFIAQQQTSIN